jgi:hypothetical protein
MPVGQQRGTATFADLEKLGEDARVEILHGVIVPKARPRVVHSLSLSGAGSFLFRRFNCGGGGRWPGGWWLGTEIDVEYAAHELFCNDLAGWRRDRVPTAPTERPVRARPDWVCEILSPSNERRDRFDKMRVLHAAGVPHYWLLDPEERFLHVHRYESGGYLIALTAAPGEVVRAEPFDSVDLRVDVLFGEEDEE